MPRWPSWRRASTCSACTACERRRRRASRAPLARVAAQDARLLAQGLTPEQVAALAAQGFVFDVDGQPARASPAASRVRRRRRRPSGAPSCSAPASPAAPPAERLCARGWHVTLVERHPAAGDGSLRQPAGIFMPLVSKDDNIPTRLTRAAYLFALRHWAQRWAACGQRRSKAQACGVLQLARDAEHADVQRAIAAARPLPPEFAEWLDAPAAASLLGLPAPDGGWLFRQGGWARPGSVCAAMLAACGERLDAALRRGRRAASSARTAQWQRDRRAAAPCSPHAPNLIAGQRRRRRALPQAAALPLQRRARPGDPRAGRAAAGAAVVLCREAYLTPASRRHLQRRRDLRRRCRSGPAPASQQENLDRLRGLLADPACGRRRAAGGAGGLSLRRAGPPAAGRPPAGCRRRRRHRAPARRAAPARPVRAARLRVARPDLGAAGGRTAGRASSRASRCRWRRAWSTRSIRRRFVLRARRSHAAAPCANRCRQLRRSKV